jgi:hypothetical protein
MARYPNEDVARLDQQFAESPAERNARMRETRRQRTIETLWTLITDLSAGLADEGGEWSVDGLAGLRRRTANALPPTKCPDWLAPYRDPAIVQS